MRYLRFAALCCILFSIDLAADAQVRQGWRVNFKNTLNSINQAVGFKVDEAGSVFVLATTWFPDSTKDILLVKFDADGKEIWRRTFDSPDHRDDIAIGLELDKEGNTWVCGTSRTKMNDTDILLVKFSPDGVPVAFDRFGVSVGLFDAPSSVSVDRAGHPSVSGYVTTADSGLNCVVIRYSPEAKLLWYRTFSTLQMDAAFTMAVDDSCNIFAAGLVNGGPHSSDMLVLKYDSAGYKQFVHRYDGIFGENDAAFKITRDDSGYVYVAGYINHNADRSDLAVLKFSRGGVLVKEFLYNCGTADCMPEHLSVQGGTSLLIGGFMDYALQESGSVVAVFSPDGKQLDFRKSPVNEIYNSVVQLRKNRLLLGTRKLLEEGVLQPMIAVSDTSKGYSYCYVDSTVMGISSMRNIIHRQNRIYFLGDDAGEATGSVSVLTYEFDPAYLDPKYNGINSSGKKAVPKVK